MTPANTLAALCCAVIALLTAVEVIANLAT